jgi:tetratricopeptide (TPR) repeat protein
VSRNYERRSRTTRPRQALPGGRWRSLNLAFAYLNLRDFDRAAAGAEAAELDPKNVIKRMNFAMYAMYAGDFETAMAESTKVLEQNPAFGYARFTLGRAAMAAGDAGTARAAFAELGAEGGMGSSLAPMGEADLEMALGRHHAAVALLDAAVGTSESPFETASMLVAMSEARLATGDARGAIDAARRGLAASQHGECSTSARGCCSTPATLTA